MSKFDASIDYLEMLGLDLSDGSRFTAEQLRQSIRDNRKEWTAQAVNPLYQQQARRNLDLIRGFEKLLGRKEALQDYLKQLSEVHVQKRRWQEREVGTLIRSAVSTRGHLTTRQREILVQQVEAEQIPAEVVDAVIERLGIEVRTPDRIAIGTPELPYETPALDKTVLAQAGNWMTILEVNSFYELLDLPVSAPLATIRSQAEIHFSKWSKVLPKTTEVVAWEKSLQACLTWLKDDDSREQYNRALFNQRIDQFVRRVDLLLAGGQVTRDDQIELTRIGSREFGLTSSIVSRVVQARVVALGIPLDKPVAVTVQMQGQCQCNRCYAWSPKQSLRCWNCGGALVKRCANPFCRKRVSSGTRNCEHCHLKNGEGRRYAALINMGDAAIRQGDWETAISAYRTARRILTASQLDARLELAGRVRSLISSAIDQVAAHRLSSARESLASLAELAPELQLRGMPTLEEISDQIRRLTAHCQTAQQMESSADAAQLWAQILDRWTDCNRAYHSLRFLCEPLAREGHADAAIEHARLLLTLRPKDDVLRKWMVKVQKWQAQRATATPEIEFASARPEPNGAHRNGSNGHKPNGNNGHQANGNGTPHGARNGVHRLEIDPALLQTGASHEG